MASLPKSAGTFGGKTRMSDLQGTTKASRLFIPGSPVTVGILQSRKNPTEPNHTSAYRQNFVLNQYHSIVRGLGVLLRSLLFYAFASADFDAPVHPPGIYSFSWGHQL